MALRPGVRSRRVGCCRFGSEDVSEQGGHVFPALGGGALVVRDPRYAGLGREWVGEAVLHAAVQDELPIDAASRISFSNSRRCSGGMFGSSAPTNINTRPVMLLASCGRIVRSPGGTRPRRAVGGERSSPSGRGTGCNGRGSPGRARRSRPAAMSAGRARWTSSRPGRSWPINTPGNGPAPSGTASVPRSAESAKRLILELTHPCHADHHSATPRVAHPDESRNSACPSTASDLTRRVGSSFADASNVARPAPHVTLDREGRRAPGVRRGRRRFRRPGRGRCRWTDACSPGSWPDR